jgi:hypothetical protein
VDFQSCTFRGHTRLSCWRSYFLFAPVMLMRPPVDIFSAINVPAVIIIWTNSGLPPSEIGSRIASVYERALTTTVDDLEHVEYQSLYGASGTVIGGLIFTTIATLFFVPSASAVLRRERGPEGAVPNPPSESSDGNEPNVPEPASPCPNYVSPSGFLGRIKEIIKIVLGKQR